MEGKKMTRNEEKCNETEETLLKKISSMWRKSLSLQMSQPNVWNVPLSSMYAQRHKTSKLWRRNELKMAVAGQDWYVLAKWRNDLEMDVRYQASCESLRGKQEYLCEDSEKRRRKKWKEEEESFSISWKKQENILYLPWRACREQKASRRRHI